MKQTGRKRSLFRHPNIAQGLDHVIPKIAIAWNAVKDCWSEPRMPSMKRSSYEPDSTDNYCASRLVPIWMAAGVTKASSVSARFSKFLARRLFRPDQEKVRSTTQRAMQRDEAFHAASGRFFISYSDNFRRENPQKAPKSFSSRPVAIPWCFLRQLQRTFVGSGGKTLRARYADQCGELLRDTYD